MSLRTRAIVALTAAAVFACGEETPVPQDEPIRDPVSVPPRPAPLPSDSGLSEPDEPPVDAGPEEPAPNEDPEVPEGCPAPTPIPAPGQVIGIQSVHFGRSEVVLRNVSNTTQTIVGGRQGWQWCNVPGYFNIVLGDDDVVLAPGETYAFQLIERGGKPRPLFDGEAAEDTNELGIYTVTGSFNSTELIVAFVSWGAGSSFESRESVGSMAGVWTFGSRVAIGPGAAGFIATGDATVGDGYTSVPDRCLPTYLPSPL